MTKKLTWKEVDEIQKTIKNHNIACANIFKLGESWGDKEEGCIRKTINEQIIVIPQISSQPKDHKEIPNTGA